MFLPRDGSKRELNVVPIDLKLESYIDQNKQTIYSLLDSNSEQRLLEVQARRRKRTKYQDNIAA
ncbi:hypothetical protein C7K08_08190 [Synechococcus lacustris str. Tous]|uniref:Uncharacterized protein n=1 Tax=Synechococcus lacustris str. Tous TaxID=1910958 RepID=A0A2P7EDS4_9SYNE|nr:hypothetical protein C7K08_08190 [Synechococcus lacustris str. Tous]